MARTRNNGTMAAPSGSGGAGTAAALAAIAASEAAQESSAQASPDPNSADASSSDQAQSQRNAEAESQQANDSQYPQGIPSGGQGSGSASQDDGQNGQTDQAGDQGAAGGAQAGADDQGGSTGNTQTVDQGGAQQSDNDQHAAGSGSATGSGSTGADNDGGSATGNDNHAGGSGTGTGGTGTSADNGTDGGGATQHADGLGSLVDPILSGGLAQIVPQIVHDVTNSGDGGLLTPVNAVLGDVGTLANGVLSGSGAGALGGLVNHLVNDANGLVGEVGTVLDGSGAGGLLGGTLGDGAGFLGVTQDVPVILDGIVHGASPTAPNSLGLVQDVVDSVDDGHLLAIDLGNGSGGLLNTVSDAGALGGVLGTGGLIGDGLLGQGSLLNGRVDSSPDGSHPIVALNALGSGQGSSSASSSLIDVDAGSQSDADLGTVAIATTPTQGPEALSLQAISNTTGGPNLVDANLATSDDFAVSHIVNFVGDGATGGLANATGQALDLGDGLAVGSILPQQGTDLLPVTYDSGALSAGDLPLLDVSGLVAPDATSSDPATALLNHVTSLTHAQELSPL